MKKAACDDREPVLCYLTSPRPSPEGEGEKTNRNNYFSIMTEKTIHEGRNVKRFREMLGIKQEALATELGDDWNQKKISLLEAKEQIEPGVLDVVAKALKVPVDSIKNFSEDAAINIISTTFNSHDQSTSVAYQSSLTFNPLEKMVELYEALLKSEREKTALLEKMLRK
jgi:transcriptional regulator with XRE-family HTH domain